MRQVRDPDGRCHFSSLKHLKDSPAHYLWNITHPRTELTRPMLVGSITDAICFRHRKIAVYDGIRRGKEWEAFREQHADEVVCNRAEHDDASGAALAVLHDPVSGPILEQPENQYQRVLQWEDWGLPCAAGIAGAGGRGGFDILNGKSGFIYDLKVTNDSSPRAIEKQIFSMSWHAQAAFYVDGAKALGMGPLDFALICVESTPPHPVTVVELDSALLDFGRRSLSMWTERLKQCEDADHWPGYVSEMIVQGLPEWLDTDAAGMAS